MDGFAARSLHEDDIYVAGFVTPIFGARSKREAFTVADLALEKLHRFAFRRQAEIGGFEWRCSQSGRSEINANWGAATGARTFQSAATHPSDVAYGLREVSRSQVGYCCGLQSPRSGLVG